MGSLKKLLWIANITVAIGIIVVIAIIFTGKGCDRDYTFVVTCVDKESSNPVENVEVRINGELLGSTNSKGQLEQKISRKSLTGTSEVIVEVEKEGWYQKVAEKVEITNKKKYSVDISMGNFMTARFEWLYRPNQNSEAQVVGGKIKLFDESRRLIAEGVTNDMGIAEIPFSAEKSSEIGYETDASEIATKYPGILSTPRDTFLVTDDSSYELPTIIDIGGSNGKAKRKFVIELPNNIDQSVLGTIAMKINGKDINPQKKEKLLEYGGDAIDGETKTISISCNDYIFTPQSKQFTMLKGKSDYNLVITKAEFCPQRNFKILCYDADNNLLTNVDVEIDGKSEANKVNSDRSIAVTKKLKDGIVTLSLTHPTYNFRYSPENGIINLVGLKRDYELVARESGGIFATIRCFDQDGKALSGVNISGDGSIRGTTGINGEYTAIVDKGGSVGLDFSKIGYVADKDVKLDIPKRGRIALDHYLWDGKHSSFYSVGLGTWIDLSNRYQVDLMAIKKMVMDRLKREYGFSEGQEYIISGKIMGAEKGGGKLIHVSISNRGNSILSAEAQYAQASDLQSAASELAGKIAEQFPFEGHVISASGAVRVYIDKARNVKVGRNLEILAIKRDKSGRLVSNEENIIADGKIVQSDGVNMYTISISNKKRNISEGDWIRLLLPSPPANITVVVKDSKKRPVEDVNIYYGDYEYFGGKTNQYGKVNFEVLGGKNVRVIGRTFESETEPKSIIVNGNVELELALSPPKPYNLSISSEPQKCAVLLDSNRIGNTPLNCEVEAGVHKLRLIDSSGSIPNERLIAILIPDKGSPEKFAAQGLEYKLSGKDVSISVDMVVGWTQERKNKVDAAIGKVDYGEAIKWIEPVSRKLTQDYADSRQKGGTIYANYLKDYDNAIKMFEEVVKVEKRYASAYYNLGYCYYNKGLYDKAIENFNKVEEYKMFLVTRDFPRIIHDKFYYVTFGLENKKANKNDVLDAADQYLDNFENQLIKKDEYKDNKANKEYFDNCKRRIESLKESKR